jgi:hypothetical protein
MGFCLIGLIGDCGNKQLTATKTDIKTEAITEITKDFTNIFSNIYDATTSNNCQTTIEGSITADQLIIRESHDIIIENIVKSPMMCELQAASESKIQSDLISSLESAIEKKLGSDIWNKLDQDATSQLGSIGNDQKSVTVTKTDTTSKSTVLNKFRNELINKISPQVIQTAKATILLKHNYKNGILIENSSNIQIRNSADAFIQSKIISNTTNDAISKVVDTQKATEILEIQDKVKNESKQTAKAGGFAEILESFGKMIGNIFGFEGILPIIIIACVAFIAYKFYGSSHTESPKSTSSQLYISR